MSENAGLILASAGAGFGALGSYRSGRYGQQVAEYNAAVAEMQAQDALVRGKEVEKRHRMQVRQLVGAQRAAFGGQGQDPNDLDSSAMDVQADAAYLGELDAITIRNNAAREAWGYQVQAKNSRMQGAISYSEGVNRAAGTILGTAGTLALRKYGLGERKS